MKTLILAVLLATSIAPRDPRRAPEPKPADPRQDYDLACGMWYQPPNPPPIVCSCNLPCPPTP